LTRDRIDTPKSAKQQVTYQSTTDGFDLGAVEDHRATAIKAGRITDREKPSWLIIMMTGPVWAHAPSRGF
jgi:hypothetical protein